MGSVIEFKRKAPELQGNGAREAAKRICKGDVGMADWLLQKLWLQGFMVVPVPSQEDPEC